MKTLEFECKLDMDANLKVPQDLALQIPKEESVRVIVLLPDSDEDAHWRRLASEQFLNGYSASDSVYDSL